MIKNNDEQKLENAQKAYEQAKARLEKAKRKQSEKKRKHETHYKCMIGGIVKKFFPECMNYEQHELEEILSVALATDDCKATIYRITQTAGQASLSKAQSQRGTKSPVRTATKEIDPEESDADEGYYDSEVEDTYYDEEEEPE
ncbi:MAG: hypothetical protein IJP92_17545 [Lachnospiraceae bacterium]|nr:hypothetical protein [Lachnospiraceae bacterium]